LESWLGEHADRTRAPLRLVAALSAKLLLAVLVAAAVAGCGDDDDERPGTTPQATATVNIVYVAPTTTDPQVAAQFPSCVTGVQASHLHPSWRDFARVDLTAAGDRWTATFSDVPVGSRERFRINDPNVCPENPTGAVTRNITANGVLLTAVVETPGTGIEPGLAFTVAADGTVTP
jgi:hypothetical protein